MTTLTPSSFWLILGLVLVISEMLTAGFFLIFIAIGSFAAALAASLGAAPWAQTVLCAVVTILGLVTLRKPIQKKLLKTISLEADVGKEIRVSEAIEPHQQTRLTYQGTQWNATNLGHERIEQGDRVTIVGIDGNILLIRKLN